MQKRTVLIFVFSLFQTILSCSIARYDPFALALEQALSDITLEIVPYPTYPNACPSCQSLTYPTNPFYYDASCQCGLYPEYPLYDPSLQCGFYPEYPNFYDPSLQCGITYPSCSNCFDYPFGGTYDPSLQCGIPYPSCSNCFGYPFGDTYPACSCYRDIREPCLMCEDPGPYYICFDGCGFDYSPPAPYIYFPQVEYPMSAMDIRPYYNGQCWCS